MEDKALTTSEKVLLKKLEKVLYKRNEKIINASKGNEITTTFQIITNAINVLNNNVKLTNVDVQVNNGVQIEGVCFDPDDGYHYAYGTDAKGIEYTKCIHRMSLIDQGKIANALYYKVMGTL